MIVTALQGGLGNQMFQYACARQLAIKNSTEIKLDLSFFDHQPLINVQMRSFELDIFHFSKSVASSTDINLFFPSKADNSASRIYHRIRKKMSGAVIVKEKSPVFDAMLQTLDSKYVYLRGYWQTEKYFSGISATIHTDFAFRTTPDFNNTELLKRIGQTNAVAIHIRRGDFLINPVHGVLPITYYEQAIRYINQKITDPVYYLFSDDPDWVRHKLPMTGHTVYVSHNKDNKSHEDLRLMMSCKHNIIANSSFSWWGAWLNKNPGKIIIAPAQWFSDTRMNATTADLIPETWIRL